MYRVSNFRHIVSNFWYIVWNFRYIVWSFRYIVSNFRYIVSKFRYIVSNPWHPRVFKADAEQNPRWSRYQVSTNFEIVRIDSFFAYRYHRVDLASRSIRYRYPIPIRRTPSKVRGSLRKDARSFQQVLANKLLKRLIWWNGGRCCVTSI